MTPERLREIEERAAQATPGPWDVLESHTDCHPSEAFGRCVMGNSGTAEEPDLDVSVTSGEEFVARDEHGWPLFAMYPEDAAFIAHARQDIPDLLAALRKARAAALEEAAVIVSAMSDVDSPGSTRIPGFAAQRAAAAIRAKAGEAHG